jgi:hypothetical protein
MIDLQQFERLKKTNQKITCHATHGYTILNMHSCVKENITSYTIHQW